MEPLQQANNVELLATLAGPSVATALLEQYGELSRLAQASCDELQRVQGLDAVKATLIKAAFLLAQRLTGESAAALPVPELQEAGPAVSRPLPAASLRVFTPRQCIQPVAPLAANDGSVSGRGR